MGKQRTGEDRKCLFCNKTFYVLLSELKRGRGKYCSNVCRAKDRIRNITPNELNADSPLRLTSCPFTCERLRELYWKEGKSTVEIAELAHVSTSSVRNWLKQVGIPIRGASQCHKLAYLHSPAYREKCAQHFRSLREAGKIPKPVAPSKKVMRIAKRASLKAAQARRQTFQCFNPSCSKTFSRCPSEVSERMYCSKSCRMKIQLQRMAQAKAEARLSAAHEAAKREAEVQFGRKFD